MIVKNNDLYNLNFHTLLNKAKIDSKKAADKELNNPKFRFQ